MIYSQKYENEIKNFVDGISLVFLNKKTVLITGGTGLLGSYLVDALLFNKNFDVKIYLLVRNKNSAIERFVKHKDDERLCVVEQNLKEDINLNVNADYIIHLASFADPKNYASFPVETMETNFFGLFNLLNFAKKCNCSKLFFASSVEIYGTSNEEMNESNFGSVNCLDTRSCYNEIKRACETLCVSFQKEYGINTIIGRFCRIYGPSMKLEDSKALSQFMMNGVTGKDIVLKSEGNQLFSYLYVSDAISGLLTLLKNDVSGDAYNISTDENLLTLKQIAEVISKKCNKKVIFDLPSKQEQSGYSRAVKAILPYSKLKALGWNPKVSMKDGIERTISILSERIR